MCVALDPKADPLHAWDSDDDFPEPAPKCVQVSHVSFFRQQSQPSINWRDDREREQELRDLEHYVVVDAVAEMLSLRHGFAMAGHTYHQQQGLQLSKWAKTWGDALNTLACAIDDDARNGPPDQIIWDFVNHLLSANPLPSHLCDLSDGHPTHISGETDSIRIIQCISGSDTYYVIEPRTIKEGGGQEPAWDLMVRDATTALECVRRFSGLGRIAIATHLALTGRAFSTCLQMANMPRPNETTGLLAGMGWCRTKWKATPYDYTGYWRHLRDWMTPSRPRAALMSGGIAWRICLNVLVPEDMSEVMLGPDDSGYGRGIRFNGDDEVSWDNELSQDDTPVISGVYKIFTGRQSNSLTSFVN